VLHAADPAARAGCAVLLCNPFGQEALRSQRGFRVLADRFARTGCATLGFDYFGTGDSDGDDDDASLATAFGGAPSSERLADDDPDRAHQSLGFELPRALRDGVAAIDASVYRTAHADRIAWLAPAMDPSGPVGGRGAPPPSGRLTLRTVAPSS
jgi:hypothetical protein